MEDRKTSGLNRRDMLAAIAAAPALMATQVSAQTAPASAPGVDRSLAALRNAQETKVVLLGTAAGPGPGRARQQTSNVIVSGDAAYVVDFGLGVTNQFARTGLPFSAIRSLFLTHHHADHNVELGPLLVIGWIRGLQPTVSAYGPPPLAGMARDLLGAYHSTMHHWAEEMHMQPLENLDVTEIMESGLVMQDDRVTVRCIQVRHTNIEPSLAYRFDFRDRSIVFSGDTVALDEMAEFAAGADVLVHHAMYEQAVAENTRQRVARGDNIDYDTHMRHMLNSHTPAEEVGRIAQQAGVRTLVLTHLTPLGIPDEQWHAAAATHFTGEIVVGNDLMVI